MLDRDNNIVYSDLTAVITGPDAGLLPANSGDPVFLPNPSYPNRRQPYREFAIHYHDDPVATQAFPEFQSLESQECHDKDTCGVTYALQAARDFFAINYGMASIGPEVWANRIKLGPMSQCATCKFEEFFLSSWAVADPAMVVDFPANSGKPATKALYPDDPSNVYHSYMGDHVSSGFCMPARTSPMFTTSMRINGCTAQTATKAIIGTARCSVRGLVHPGYGVFRQRQPEPDSRRLDLPLPLLPALRAGHVEPLAGA